MIFFSIATFQHIAHAKVLLNSIKKHHSSEETFLVLAEDPIKSAAFLQQNTLGHPIVTLDQLKIEELTALSFSYDAEEFAFIIKPWAVDYFLKTYSIVIYCDATIKLFQPLTPLFEGITTHELLVTPCITTPLHQDGRCPSPVDVLKVGQLHPGFFSIQSSLETHTFLQTWKESILEGLGTMDPVENWSGHQLFFSSLISFVSSIKIIRDPCYHFSIWNASQRRLSLLKDNQIEIDNKPLVFLNFQGWVPPLKNTPEQPLWVQRRFFPSLNALKEELSLDVLKGICQTYETDVLHAEKALVPYSKRYTFSYYSQGDSILYDDRRAYLYMGAYEKKSFGNPFQKKEEIRKKMLTFSRKKRTEMMIRELEDIHKSLAWKILQRLIKGITGMKKYVYAKNKSKIRKILVQLTTQSPKIDPPLPSNKKQDP